MCCFRSLAFLRCNKISFIDALSTYHKSSSFAKSANSWNLPQAESYINWIALILSSFLNSLCCFVATLTLSLTEDKSKYETNSSLARNAKKIPQNCQLQVHCKHLCSVLKSFTFSFPLYISKFTFNKILGKTSEFYFLSIPPYCVHS